MVAPFTFPQRPGDRHSLRRGALPLFLAVLLAPLAAYSQPMDTAPEDRNSDCVAGFSPDDLALFNFVETRAQVNFGQYASRTIGSIEYRVLPIFNEQDPDENNWLFRAANRLHIDTREGTLRKQMIIHAGEPLDPRTLTENERLLRSNGYLIDAMILPRRICEDRIDLLVVVRDVWTFSPSVSASRTGGEDSSDAGLSEDNLFGTGQSLSLGYYHDADRNGRTLRYRNPLIHERWAFRIGAADNSDGEELDVSLIRPFYELNSTWSAGATSSYSSLRQEIEYNDQVINSYLQTREGYSAFLGWSQGRQNDTISRWQFGVSSSTERFRALDDTRTLPTDERQRYPWISWSFEEERFATADNINRSHRQEDIQLGFSHYVQLGYAHEDFDSDRNEVVFTLSTGYATYMNQRHLVHTQLYTRGQRDSTAVRRTFFGSAAHYYYFINEKNRWYARISFDGARRIREDEQLTIGGDDLRGYPDDYQRGNRRWVMSIERRRFSNWHIFNLAYVGVAGYIDVGSAWNTEGATPTSPETLANVGLGLRLSPSKFRVDKVLHIDVASPLVNRDEVDDHQIIVSGKVDF